MTRDQRLVLVAAVLGSFMALLDGTIVNVALPAVRDDLGGGLAGQQWVVNAYLLTLGSLILVGGSLGDVFGERRVFGLGVAGFGVVSALCAAAPSIEVLVAARGLQGVFGALLTPASLALIIGAFPERERGAAIGTWTAYGAIAALVGPLLGGQLVDTLSWRWVFWVNVPVVAVTLLLAVRLPAVTRDGPRRRPDVVGAVLCAAGLAGPTIGLVRQPAVGWGSPEVLGPVAGGLLLLAAFVAWQRRAPDPMLPLHLFEVRAFRWGNVETLAMYAGLGALFFLLVLFLQGPGGRSATEAGLATVPITVVMFVLSRRFGALAARHGPRRLMGVGPLVGAAGAALLAVSVDEDVSLLTQVLPGVVVFALGLSMTVAPLTATVLADVDDRHAGIASGVNNAVARVAALLATAAVGTIVGGAVDLDGFRAGMSFAAGLLVVAGLVGLVLIRDPEHEVVPDGCERGQLDGPAPPAAAAEPVGAR